MHEVMGTGSISWLKIDSNLLKIIMIVTDRFRCYGYPEVKHNQEVRRMSRHNQSEVRGSVQIRHNLSLGEIKK